MGKNLLCFVIILCLIMSMSGAVLAADEQDLYFEIENGEAELVKTRAGLSGEVYIPDEYEGVPVTSIAGDAFRYAKIRGVTSLRLPAGLKRIGDGAFQRIDSMTEVTFPATLEYVGSKIFFGKSHILHFTGPAPTFAPDAFDGKWFIALYPADAEGWEDAVQNQYGAERLIWSSGSIEPEDLPPDASGPLAAMVSSNENYENYYACWSHVVRSYLTENEDGTLTRIEYYKDLEGEAHIALERYRTDGTLIWTGSIPVELPRWGGFYSGPEYNFFVFGQSNEAHDPSVEVIRIVRYTKNWHRVDSASVSGSHVAIPFDLGCLRMAQCGDMLYIHTCEEGYSGHQFNLSLELYLPAMAVLENNTGYVSHSFNQFVIIDGEDVIRLDHGDGYPRAFQMTRNAGEAGKLCLKEEILAFLPFIGKEGNNVTRAEAGGLAGSSTHYLAVGNCADQTEGGDKMQNLFVAAVDKENFTAEGLQIRWLTSYVQADGIEVSTPQLVQLDADRFLLMWVESPGRALYTKDGTLFYVFLDGKGETVSQVYSNKGIPLSECNPIVSGDSVTWYVTCSTEPTFYRLKLSDPEMIAVIPIKIGETSMGFQDVEAGKYYSEAVTWAVNHEPQITNGTGNGTFSPLESVTRGQAVTFLWRAAGKPAAENGVNPFADVAETAYYRDAVLWAAEKGVTNGTGEGLFSPDEAVTCDQMLAFLCRASGENAGGSDWSEAAVNWARGRGLLEGIPDFDAKAKCPRCDVVYYLWKQMAGA